MSIAHLYVILQYIAHGMLVGSDFVFWVFFGRHVQLFAADNARAREYWVARYEPNPSLIPETVCTHMHTNIYTHLTLIDVRSKPDASGMLQNVEQL